MTDIDISKWKVDPKDFVTDPDKRSIKNSSGGNGLVTFCIEQKTGRKCVKKKTLKTLKNEDTRRNFNREVFILGSYQHPALVPLLGYYEIKNSGFIILEAIEKGSLLDNIEKNNKDGDKDPLWDDTHKLIIAYGIACAMEYLHSDNIIHRDLKPGNVLLDAQLRPFVTDFGTSKQVDPTLSVQQTISETTPIIMAPEFFEDPLSNKDSPKLDIYSYAITLYQLITGLAPFDKVSILSLMMSVSNGERPPIPDYIPDIWKDLINQCWEQNPELRPNFTEICNILESPTFVNNKINKNVFKTYMKIVKPLRPESSYSSISASRSSGDIEDISKQETKIEEEVAPTESPVLINLREEAKKGDNISSIFAYADALFTGKYGSPNIQEAQNIFISLTRRKGITTKDLRTAEYYAGQCFAQKGDYEMANKFLNLSVNHGNPDAAFYLAELMFTEKKIPITNNQKVDKLYKIAADAGIPQAIKQYAFISYYGTFDGHPNSKKANYYFKKGSDNGDPELVYIWATRNEFGRGIEKNIEEAMKLMRYAAEDLNYPDAQFDLGLHLYNGINVPKDIDEANKFFEIAARSGHPTAMLYHYLALERSDSEDDRNSAGYVFNECLSKDYIEKGMVDPDTWAINGKKLLDTENKDLGLTNLQFAMSAGSIYAMNTLGNVAEESPDQYGDPDYYYQQSANHCHCLDEFGFTTPIEYKVFHCIDCEQDICEGCAKHCHSDHSFREVEPACGFKCECGAKGFPGKCTGEFVGEEFCNQHLYQCKKCNGNQDTAFICKGCAEKCHKGHDLIDCGIQKNFCSCGMKNLPFNFKCKLLDYEQTQGCSVMSHWTDPVKQRWFSCVSCGLFGNFEQGVCKNCANTCHYGHVVVDLGVRSQSCKCMVYEKCTLLD